MKSLKQFIKTKLKKTPEGHVIIQEPLHFKDFGNTAKPIKILSITDPIHFKDIVKEDSEKEILDDLPGHEPHSMSYKLRQNHDDINLIHRAHIKHYTGEHPTNNVPNSRELNRNLAKGASLSHEEEKMHHAIIHNVKPAGSEVHLYSGSRHDFSKMAKNSKDHILHSPAHISATHDKQTAYEFAYNGMVRNKDPSSDEKIPLHINHIHVHPDDKILHASGMSKIPEEHESIIPAGTKLKYHHTTNHTVSKNKIHVHHFTIHSQD